MLKSYTLHYQYTHPFSDKLDRSDDWVVQALSEDDAIEQFREEHKYSCYAVIDVHLTEES